MVSNINSRSSGESVSNYYEELSLDDSMSASQITQELRAQRSQLQRRAMKSGDSGIASRERISLIDVALIEFATEESKRAYDDRLRLAHDTSTDNWIMRTLEHLDNGSINEAAKAADAARKSRPNSPLALRVSALVALRSEDYSCGLDFIHEAIRNSQSVSDIAYARTLEGDIYYEMGRFDRAIEAYVEGLQVAEGELIIHLTAQKVMAHSKLSQLDDVIIDSVQILSSDIDMPKDMQRLFEMAAYESILDRGNDKYDLTATVENYVHNRNVVAESAMRHDSKELILARIDLQIRLRELASQLDELERAPVGEPHPVAELFGTCFPPTTLYFLNRRRRRNRYLEACRQVSQDILRLKNEYDRAVDLDLEVVNDA